MKILPIGIPGIKPIYFIKENGELYNKNMKKKKETIDKYGYKYSSYIKVDGTKVKLKSHRVVIGTFQKNIENKPTVNHIDGDKLNNHNENLEYATYKEQAKHAIKNSLFRKSKTGKDNKNSKTVYVFNEKFKLIDTIQGLNETAKKYNMTKSLLSSKIRNNVKSLNENKILYFSYLNKKPFEKIKRTTGIKIKEIFSGIIFESYKEAMQYFKISWKTINNSIKYNSFEKHTELYNYNKRLKKYLKFELLEAQQTIESSNRTSVENKV